MNTDLNLHTLLLPLGALPCHTLLVLLPSTSTGE